MAAVWQVVGEHSKGKYSVPTNWLICVYLISWMLACCNGSEACWGYWVRSSGLGLSHHAVVPIPELHPYLLSWDAVFILYPQVFHKKIVYLLIFQNYCQLILTPQNSFSSSSRLLFWSFWTSFSVYFYMLFSSMWVRIHTCSKQEIIWIPSWIFLNL